MIILIYNADGSKGLLQLRQQDAAANVPRYLDAGAHLRVLDGCDLADAGSILDSRLPDTIAAFDLLYPDQPAIVS